MQHCCIPITHGFLLHAAQHDGLSQAHHAAVLPEPVALQIAVQVTSNVAMLACKLYPSLLRMIAEQLLPFKTDPGVLHCILSVASLL